MKKVFLLAITLLLGACTHSLHISHVSDFAPTYASYAQGKLVKSRQEQFVILGFVSDTNYVNQAYYQLMKQCQNGQVQGITTQYSTSHGFFSWTHVVEMQGLCI